MPPYVPFGIVHQTPDISPPVEGRDAYYCPRCGNRLWNLWGELTCPFCGYEHEVPRAITAAAAFAEAERAYREAKDAIYGDLAEAAG